MFSYDLRVQTRILVNEKKETEEKYLQKKRNFCAKLMKAIRNVAINLHANSNGRKFVPTFYALLSFHTNLMYVINSHQ